MILKKKKLNTTVSLIKHYSITIEDTRVSLHLVDFYQRRGQKLRFFSSLLLDGVNNGQRVFDVALFCVVTKVHLRTR